MTKTTEIELTNAEFNFLTALDNLAEASAYNFNLLKTQYLHTIMVKNDYEPEENEEMSIDLKSEDHILTITKLDYK